MTNTINSYYDCFDDFDVNFAETDCNFLRIAQWNVRGINNMQKFDNILLFLDNMKGLVDILVVGETWLKQDNCTLFRINNYEAIFSCRDTSSGGLAVYIKKGLSFNIIKNISVDGLHLIHIKIKMNGISYDVVGVY